MQRWGSSMQLGMARKCWGHGQRDKREKHGRRGCGEAGGQYDACSDGGVMTLTMMLGEVGM